MIIKPFEPKEPENKLTLRHIVFVGIISVALIIIILGSLK